MSPCAARDCKSWSKFLIDAALCGSWRQAKRSRPSFLLRLALDKMRRDAAIDSASEDLQGRLKEPCPSPGLVVLTLPGEWAKVRIDGGLREAVVYQVAASGSDTVGGRQRTRASARLRLIFDSDDERSHGRTRAFATSHKQSNHGARSCQKSSKSSKPSFTCPSPARGTHR
jgi:hypothetical protein